MTRDVTGQIAIESDNVVLDLGGHSVHSTNAAISIDNGHHNVTVKNGRATSVGTTSNAVLVANGESRSSAILLADLMLEVASSTAVNMNHMDSVEVRRCRANARIRASGNNQPMTGRFVDNVVIGATAIDAQPQSQVVFGLGHPPR